MEKSLYPGHLSVLTGNKKQIKKSIYYFNVVLKLAAAPPFLHYTTKNRCIKYSSFFGSLYLFIFFSLFSFLSFTYSLFLKKQEHSYVLHSQTQFPVNPRFPARRRPVRHGGATVPET